MDSKKFLQITLTGLFVFFTSWLIIYKTNINKLAIQSEDTVPTMLLPVAIIKEKTLYLNSYYDMMIDRYPHPDDKNQVRGLTPFYLKKIGDKYASAFPIITGLLAIPVYFLPVKLGKPVTWENIILLSKISSALTIALSGGFLYLLLKKQFSLNEKSSAILSYIYLFGTVNFAMLSQGMWQHGSLQLFSILGLYFILDHLKQPEFRPFKAILGGFYYGLAILSRPTGALAFLLIILLVLFKTRHIKPFIKATFFILLGLLVNVLFFIWYNNEYYLGIQNQGYSGQILTSWLSPFPISFLGVWLSPSKGILIYSPIFIISLAGFYISIKKGWRENFQYIVYFLIVLSHTLIISFWKHWYGGYSFGYRMSSDVILYLIILMVPFMKSSLFDRHKIMFFTLAGLSIFMQLFGIIFFDGIWHSAYDKGFRDTSWLWSIKDSEFIFNVRRILVKFKALDRACPECLPFE